MREGMRNFVFLPFVSAKNNGGLPSKEGETIEKYFEIV